MTDKREWVLVPREPTKEMIEAICSHHGSGEWPDGYGKLAQAHRRADAVDGYRAMLTAAPQPPIGGDVAMEAWHAAVNDAGELRSNAPDERYARRAANVESWIKANRTAPPSAPVGVEALVERWRTKKRGLSALGCANELEHALAQQPDTSVLAKYQPCGCVICTCEDERRCHGCGAKHCGNRTDHPAYVTRNLAAEAERKFFSRDFYEEAREGKKPWPGQQPAACPKCDGTGEADSGGIMPWGAPATIPCDCQQPAAVDESADFEIHAGGEYFASVGGPRERAWKEAMHYVSTLHPDDGEPEVFEVTRRKVDIAAQPGGPDNDR